MHGDVIFLLQLLILFYAILAENYNKFH